MPSVLKEHWGDQAGCRDESKLKSWRRRNSSFYSEGNRHIDVFQQRSARPDFCFTKITILLCSEVTEKQVAYMVSDADEFSHHNLIHIGFKTYFTSHSHQTLTNCITYTFADCSFHSINDNIITDQSHHFFQSHFIYWWLATVHFIQVMHRQQSIYLCHLLMSQWQTRMTIHKKHNKKVGGIGQQRWKYSKEATNYNAGDETKQLDYCFYEVIKQCS